MSVPQIGHCLFVYRPITSKQLKMLVLYLLGQKCLHLTFEQYLSSETYSSKYEKLPNIVILACKNIKENMHLLKMSGPQIWLCLFTFRPITSKQLNGLTTIVRRRKKVVCFH